MPSTPVPNLTQAKLKQLAKLLSEYAKHIEGEQPLAAQIIRLVFKWVDEDIE
jgi:hypothetical protein